jgi:hypothetical protein
LSYELIKNEKIEPTYLSAYWKKIRANRIVIGFTPDSPPFCMSQVKPDKKKLYTSKEEIKGKKIRD